jgi:CRP/FNR family transcriptional regulator, cyclic AMP receptor protein
LGASTAATLLARVEPFRGLDERVRLTVVEHAGRRVVDKGQMVFWQDDPGEAIFVLLEGSVKLVCSRDGELIELHRHDAPAIFGELAVLDGGPPARSATWPS